LFCGGSLRKGHAGSKCPNGICAHAARSECWNPFFAFAVTLVEAACTIVLSLGAPAFASVCAGAQAWFATWSPWRSGDQARANNRRTRSRSQACA